ncbi:hypothetical protein [Nocardia jiangxiensis]|uniref:Uncharacterized protein n=1 Tax=Nocardia jiangxiensis TaxID=282685 RepID=A0ABW6RYH6_9NOCA|nr:hypothetical protein [Nocardia jiangxiensis]
MQISTERILMIGLHPNALDYSKLPDLDEATLTARIEAGNAALRAAGFDAVSCQIPADPAQAETRIREHLADGPFGLVMIGAGIRANVSYTLLFEQIVNVVTEVAPGIRFCFNTSPENTVDTLRRWVTP